jgi:hypothetical protein
LAPRFGPSCEEITSPSDVLAAAFSPHLALLPIVVVVVVVVVVVGSECRDQLAVRGVREESVRPQQRAQLVGGEAPKTARVRRRVGRHVTRG